MNARIDRRLSLARTCASVAFANLTQHRTRLIVAFAGIGVAVLLLLIQMAFLHAVRVEATRLYGFFDFDIALAPDTYQFLRSGGSFDRARLSQAAGDPDVAGTFGLNVDSSQWVDKATLKRSVVMLIGIDDAGDFVRDPDIRKGFPALGGSAAVLADAWSSPDFGPLAPGTEATVAERPVTIAGLFRLGLFFYADGSVIVPNAHFFSYVARDPQYLSFGFLKLVPGADAGVVRARLAKAMPNDVRVLTREQLIDKEQAFFISTKPIGVMVRISMAIAFLVGAVILFQVLSAEIINRAHEFATLKAMGFAPQFVFGVGILETLFLAAGAFLPALILGALLLWFVEATTHLPAALTPGLVGLALLVVLLMCLMSGALVLRRIARADPAELY